MTYKLHLSEVEFRNLALTVYLGNWMANAQAVPGEGHHPEIEAILQKLYKAAKENGVPGLKIKQEDGHYYSVEHDGIDAGDTHSIIEQYDEQAMFETLAHNMAGRDIHEKIVHGKKPAVAEDVASTVELELSAYDDYMEEFAEHGIGRVVVDRQRVVPCEEDEDS